MGSWFKDQADKLARATQQHVSELQQSASQLAGGVFEISTNVGDPKNVEFADGPLGFRLEGTVVVGVEKDGQAAQLGVQVGDCLAAIGGNWLPEYEVGDVLGENEANKQAGAWMRELPRPLMMTFFPPMKQAQASDNTEHEIFAIGDMEDDHDEAGTPDAGNQGKPSKPAEEVQTQSCAMGADTSDALAAAEARERLLAEEVARLRKTLKDKELAAAETTRLKAAAVEAAVEEMKSTMQELLKEKDEILARAEASERQSAQLTNQIQGFQAAHEAEIELLREEQRKQESEHHQETQRAQDEHASELGRVLKELEQAKSAAEEGQREAAAQTARAEAAIESAAAAAAEAVLAKQNVGYTLAAASAGCDVAGAATGPLQERIRVLEDQCSSLQEKLNSQPAIFHMAPSLDLEAGGLGLMQRRPSWEPWLASSIGAHAAARFVTLYRVPGTGLRTFTQRLLRRDLWLCVFYAHLLVLYAIAASSFANVTPLADPGAVVEGVGSGVTLQGGALISMKAATDVPR